MPTYDYQCRDCGAVTEVIHAMSEDGPTVCDACGGSLRRVLYPAGIIFKGSGFYRTDSRAAPTPASSESSTAKGSADGAPPGGGGSSSAGEGGSASPSTPKKASSDGRSTPSVGGGSSSGSSTGD